MGRTLYLKVKWNHSFEGEPVLLFSELDADRYETRKVEVFRDGRMTYADDQHSTGATVLGEKPLPSIDDIRAESEFEPSEISKSDFEEVWSQAMSS